MSEFLIERYKTTIDLSKEGHTGCPRCIWNGRDRARDNLYVYGLTKDHRHKGAYCHSCEWVFPDQDHIENNQEEETLEVDVVGREFNYEIHQQLKGDTGLQSRGYRGISDEYSKFYAVRYRYDQETGEVDEVFYPCTIDGEISGYKIRKHPKTFSPPFGETGKTCDLFGQFRFKDTSSSYVLITAGEHDTLAAAEMLHGDQKRRGKTDFGLIPVVSATIGESGSHKQIQQQYDWLDRFDRIVYCPDSDEAGQQAVDKIFKVVPKGKLFLMRLPLKDPNDMLISGREREFVNAFYKATPYTPVGIVGSGGLLDKMVEAAKVPKIPLPPFMHKVQKLMAGGIPLKTILNLGSASGAGKTTFAGELVYYWVFHSPHKIGIVSLEDDCAQYGTKMLSRHIGQKIDLIESTEDKIAFLQRDDIVAASNDLFFNSDGSHRFNLVDDRDGSLEELQEKIEELIIVCECKVIILDPLQDILDGMSNEEQAVFMKWMKGMIKSHDVTFICINHVRKSGGGQGANSTGVELYEEDFQGSSAIFKSAACNLLFMRNKEAESELERNITRMKMSKCRWTGITAPVAGRYFYCNAEHRMYDLDDYLTNHPEVQLMMPEE